MRDLPHIAVAGAGIIGLACALTLRRRGWQVTVLDAGLAMKEASWAAGGMLAVDDPENPAALSPLSRYSRSLYEPFLQAIESLSGRTVRFRTAEALQIVPCGAAAASGTVLSPEEAQHLVPNLNAQSLEAAGNTFVLLPEVSLDPRDLCVALPEAVRAAGITLREEERVVSHQSSDSGICITTTRGTLLVDALLNCCGAWAPALGASAGAVAGIAPRKGQMLVVAQPAGPPLTRVLRSPDVYLIPRGDGRIAVGATVEDAGYSKQVDAHALLLLRNRAAELWSPAREASMIESWAGLRPASADGLPSIGRWNDTEGPHFVAAGHYRNGILLAPGTAEIVADLVSGKTPALDVSPFAPQRLVTNPACDKRFAAAL